MDETYATLYIGALLTRAKAMEIFETKYEPRIQDTCPKDCVPNKDRKNYCADCGTDLRYKHTIKSGADKLEDINNLTEIIDLSLDTYLLDTKIDGAEGIIIGKEITTSTNIEEGGQVLPLELNFEEEIREVQHKLSSFFRINETVKTYLITSNI